MSDDRGFKRAIDDWLSSGSDRTPTPAVNAVLLAVQSTPQERDLRIPWRTPPMPAPLRLAAAIAIASVVGYAGLSLLNPPNGPGAVTPTPSPTTPAPSLTPEPTLAPIDTTGWVTYTSSLYELSIGHPPGWEEIPASRLWSYEVDTNDWLSPGMEAFFTADGLGVRVSTWGVPWIQASPTTRRGTMSRPGSSSTA